ncbi:hypothetical protein [Bosea beijingensis]
MKRIVFILSLLAAPAMAEAASVYCSSTSAPSCASRFGKFDDEDDFARCKRQIEAFRSETEEMLRCLQSSREEALNEFNEAVESFNRRARAVY